MDRQAGSWVVTRRATGEVVGEFFNWRTVRQFNPAAVVIETAGEYLSRINREIAEAERDQQATIERAHA